MSKPFLTVFTPTYNRAYTLQLNYNALLNQNDKDFVWMIVDDGSNDNTEVLVKSWISENKIKIQYIKQINRGKPSATNLSIERAESTLWVCIDSDDYIAYNAIAIIRKEYAKAKHNSTCGAIVGAKYDMETGKPVGIDGTAKLAKEVPREQRYVHHWELEYKYRHKADKVYVFFLDKLKKYRYPILPGEKFIGESYLYEQFGTKYFFYLTYEKLYYCKYLNDGMTASYLQLHVKNPKGYKLLKEQMMQYPKPLFFKFKAAIMYVAGCKLCGDTNIIKNSPCRMMTALAYPLGILAYKKKYGAIIVQNNEN